MAKLPRVAVIGTGGTISSIGHDSLDVLNYSDTGKKMESDALVARFPECASVADVLPIRYSAVPSPAIGPKQWLELLKLIHDTAAREPDLAGFVVTHGTATLEETAYFLHLALKIDLPVVLVGAQRPASALGTDAGMNLVGALRVAGSAAARGKGVLVCLNDEIQSARDVAKTSTLRLQTFRSPDFGALGHVDGDGVFFYRAPTRRHAPDTEFDLAGIAELPRVDIVLSYAGADATMVNAAIAVGAKGIVSAGFAPGMPTVLERAALEAAAKDIVVVQSSRVGSGRVTPRNYLRSKGMLGADSLTPQKARILLMLGLTCTQDKAELARMFQEY
ncbi:asparaginase [Desertibaculum subflavum]|uniref:asparaginase n=1 Tax=Desertibaculum subflavum TaxID=2268458 RepID=UPI000E6639FA